MSSPTSTSDPHGRGQRAVDFIRRLKHPKSRARGQAFELVPWQEALIRQVYGGTDVAGQRKVRTVFALIPRGGRKTTLGAALTLLHTVGPERETGGYAVSVACDREQARIAFDEAKSMIEMQRPLMAATWVRDSRNLIEHPKSGSRYYAASADAKAAWGKTPTFALADELHAWHGETLWRAIRTGMAKSAGSLLWIITTAGRGRDSLAWSIYDYARKVVDGSVVDEGFLPVIYAPGAGVDIEREWRDEALWHEVNPGLAHGFPDLEGLRQMAREAESRPADRVSFQQYHLNHWPDQAVAPWLDMAAFDGAALEITLDDIPDGARCWVGVDLAATTDLCAVCTLFERAEGGFVAIPWFAVPQVGIERRSAVDNVLYDAWAREGVITATEGSVVDYDAVESYVTGLAERFEVMGVAIDPWNSVASQTRLAEQGLNVVRHRQGFASMSPAMKETERLLLSGELKHDGNSCLRWCIGNTSVATDPAGNIKPDKGRSVERIDGATALIMACGIAEAQQTSVYSERPSFLMV